MSHGFLRINSRKCFGEKSWRHFPLLVSFDISLECIWYIHIQYIIYVFYSIVRRYFNWQIISFVVSHWSGLTYPIQSTSSLKYLIPTRQYTMYKMTYSCNLKKRDIHCTKSVSPVYKDKEYFIKITRKAVISGLTAGGLAQFIASPTDLVKVQMQMEGRRRLEGHPARYGLSVLNISYLTAVLFIVCVSHVGMRRFLLLYWKG